MTPPSDRELAEGRALLGPTPDAPDFDLGAIEEALADEMERDRGMVARARELPRAARLAALGVLVLVEALFFASYLRRSDFDTYPAARMMALLGLYGAGSLILGWLAMRPLYLPPLSRRAELAVLAAGFGLPLLVALLPEVATTAPEAAGFNYPGWAYYCLVDGGGLALVAFFLVRLLDRSGLALASGGLTAAAAAGFAGLLGLQIQCPINYPMHLVTGHVTVPLAVAALVLVARRLQR